MTLLQFLRPQHANPTDPTSPLLYVSEGFLSDKAQAHVASDAYKGLPYCYLLNVGEAVVQLYDNGTARYQVPVDVVFETAQEKHKPILDLLWNGVFNSVWQVDEVRPGLKLTPPFRVTGGYQAESRRPGFWESMLRLESSW